MLNSYEILTALEVMGAHTVEIEERWDISERPMIGVAKTMDNGKILCNVESETATEDSELTPEQFNQRFIITCGVFH